MKKIKLCLLVNMLVCMLMLSIHTKNVFNKEHISYNQFSLTVEILTGNFGKIATQIVHNIKSRSGNLHSYLLV
jgi:hypothetical protein